MNEDLKWLAENVHEWPEHRTYAVVWHEKGRTKLLWDCGTVYGESYTRAQWQAARVELSGKPEYTQSIEKSTENDGMCDKFQVGDMVHVVKSGYGCGDECVGMTVSITGVGEYFDDIGYRVDPPIGNTQTQAHDGMIGWQSFKRIDKVANERTWRGPEDGLPPVGLRVELHNEPGYCLDYMQSAIGEEVTVKAVFYSGDSNIPMVAVETDDKTCGCFRVAMLKPCKTEEDNAVDRMREIIVNEYRESTGSIPSELPDSDSLDRYLSALYRAGLRFTDKKPTK